MLQRLVVSAALLRRLQAYPKILPTRFAQMMLRAEATAKQFVSGPVLKVRTGNLRSRIAHRVESQGGRLVGFLGTKVVYGAIHELGGTIPAHLVVARRAKALRIPVASGFIFRRSAQIPAIQMPKRPYLVPALKLQMAWFREIVRQDIARGRGR